MKRFYSIKYFRILAAVLIIHIGCKDTARENDKELEILISAKAEVSVINPHLQNITEYLQLNGLTQFQKKDIIRSNNTGFITSLNFKLGDPIKTGDVFCTIGTKEQQALKQISINDSSLNKFQKPLTVTANGSGFITSINVLQGDYIAEGDVLANVSEPSSLIVVVNVPYEQHEYAAIGKSCEIILPDGKVIPASISGMMSTVDAATQSQSFYIRLKNQTLPENLNVTIRIAHKQNSNSICINSSAIQTDELQKEFWVMKLINDSLAVKVSVETGLHNDSLTEIISKNISLNDKIVNLGAYQLGDSSTVIVKN